MNYPRILALILLLVPAIVLPVPAIVAQPPAATPEPTSGDKASTVSIAPSSLTVKPALSKTAKDYIPSDPRYVRKDGPVRIPKLETPPVIDGKLDDAAWQNAAVFGDFLQTSPGDNVEPTHPTEFMMAYDSKNLYMAYRIKQDRNTVRATMARRDNIFNDDYVLVYIDTFNDQRQAYVIFFNPLGIQADGTFTEGRGEDYSVDLLMDSKGVLTEDGFTIEAAVPFKSLRYEAGKNKMWGLQIYRRVKYKNNEYNSWMPHNRSINGYLNQAALITGLEGIETTRQLEINPSFTISQTGRRTAFTFNNDPAGRFVNEGIRGEFGMTAKFGLTPTITLDFAYNPDFAQVEADAPINTANLRFPVFFPEKRPFFLERIDIFQSGLNVVNTRAIVDPDIAAKLTGRRGKNTFGVLYASDNGPGNLLPDDRERLRHCLKQQAEARNRGGEEIIICGDERVLEKNADIGVLRVKRDIGRHHNLGMFATTYNFVDRHNHTAGIDGRFRLSPSTVTEFQILGTHTRGYFDDPDLGGRFYRTGNGLGYRVYLERTGRNLYMNYLASGRSPNYVAQVGFTDRVDTNYLGSFIQYQTDRDAKKSIIYKRFQNGTNIRYDWQGRSQYFISESQAMLALQRQTFVGLGHQRGYERVFEHEYGLRRSLTRKNPEGSFFGPDSERSAHFNALYTFIETTPHKKFFGLFFMDYTKGQMDFDFGAGRDFPRVSPAALALGQRAPFDPGPGDQLFLEVILRYQPTTAFQTQLNYTKRRLVRHDTGLVAFDDNVYSSRSVYQFTRNTFARLRVDYSNVSNRVRPQFVLGWTPSPGTAIYAGYNDILSYNGHNPFTGLPEPGLRTNERSFFIKASYLFRKSF